MIACNEMTSTKLCLCIPRIVNLISQSMAGFTSALLARIKTFKITRVPPLVSEYQRWCVNVYISYDSAAIAREFQNFAEFSQSNIDPDFSA